MVSQPYSGLRRVPYVQRCRLSSGGTPRDALVCNIGVEGVYVSLDPIPAVGERLHVSLSLPGSHVVLEVEAEVTWRNTLQRHKVHSLPPGCGLHFLALSQADRARIEALVGGYTPPRGR